MSNQLTSDVHGVSGKIALLDHVLDNGETIELPVYNNNPSPTPDVLLVGFNAVLGSADIGPTGIDPNDQGYTAMLAVVQRLIQQLDVGGAK